MCYLFWNPHNPDSNQPVLVPARAKKKERENERETEIVCLFDVRWDLDLILVTTFGFSLYLWLACFLDEVEDLPCLPFMIA